MAYEIFHDTPSTDGAAGDRIVYLRATTVLTPYVFAEERPRRITAEERETSRGTSSPTSSRAVVRRRCQSRSPATTRSTSGSPTSTSTGTSTT